MPSLSCLLLPGLHPELLPPEYAGTRCCKPWIARGEADAATPLVNLPLQGRVAEAALREWQNLSPDELQQEVTRAAAARFDEDNGLFPGEARELQRFQGKTDSDETARRIQAQRMLLLAWAQEERVLAIRSLRASYRRSAAQLAHLLGEEAGILHQEDLSGSDEEETLLPSWRFVLRAMRLFLPDNAVFVVASRDMAATLHRLSPARELDEATRRSLPLPQTAQQALRACKVSLGVLLGKPAADPDPERLFLI